jgi:hypothetical protein
MIGYLIDNMQNYYIEYFTLDKEWSYNNAKPFSRVSNYSLNMKQAPG